MTEIANNGEVQKENETSVSKTIADAVKKSEKMI